MSAAQTITSASASSESGAAALICGAIGAGSARAGDGDADDLSAYQQTNLVSNVAGLAPGAWKDDATRVFTFEGEALRSALAGPDGPRLARAVTVLKTRAAHHEPVAHRYEISKKGLVLGDEIALER